MGKKGSNPVPRPKPKEVDSKMKYILFLALFTFPALAALLGSTGSVLGNLSALLTDFRMLFVTVLLAMVATCAFIYSKRVRATAKYTIPAMFAILLFPTFQVYVCSPIEVENAGIGTDFSLKATAKEFMEKTAIGCFNKTKLPGSLYGISIYTPKLSLSVKHNEIVDLNLTANSRKGGAEVKTHKIVLIRSLRSVRKKIHSLYMMARAPLKLKKFEKGLKEKKNFVLNGRLSELAPNLKNVKAELEKKGLFIRPFLYEVKQVELRDRPKEPEKKQEPKKEEETKEPPKDDKKNETKTEKEKPKSNEQSRPDEVKEDAGDTEDDKEDKEPEYVIEDEDEDATIEEETW